MSVELQHQLELAEAHLKFAARMAMSEDAASLEHHQATRSKDQERRQPHKMRSADRHRDSRRNGD